MVPRSGLLVPIVCALLISATTAHAQTVTTQAATGVTDIAATFNGSVTTSGATLYAYFQWGTTTAYGASVMAAPFNLSPNATTAVTAIPWGLQPNTTYHYRVWTQSASDNSIISGDDQTFTTGPPATPPSITGQLTITVEGKTLVLAAVASVNAGGSPATFGYEYGTTTAYGSYTDYGSTLTTNNPVGQPLTYLYSLAPGTTYHVRGKATNAQGTVYTDDVTFTTRAAAVPSTGTATNITDLTATLNGTITANGNALTMTFEWGPTTNYGGVMQVYGSGVDPQSLSAAITGLLPNTLYHYRLTIYDYESGYSYGSDSTFTTGAPATPPTVGDVSAPVVGNSSAQADVNGVNSGSSPATVTIEYGPTTAYGLSAPYGTTIPTNTTAYPIVTLTGLSSSTLYHFRCKATNSEGTAYSADGTFTTLPAPILVTGSATGITDLSASFSGSINPVGGNIADAWFDIGTTTSYGTSLETNPSSITGTSAVPVSASTAALLPGTLYHYRLRASDGQSNYYGPDQTFTTGAPATPPTVGTVNAYYVSTTSATLQCYPVYSGSSAATVVFQYGTTTDYGSSATADPLPTNAVAQAPQVALSNLSPLTTYHVRCVVTNNEGTATTADTTFATYGSPVVTTSPATSVGDLSATLNGSLNPNGPSTTATAVFDLGTDTTYGTTVTAPIGVVRSPSLITFTGAATGLLPNTTYHYRARASFTFTNSTYVGADQTFTTGAPATPPSIATVSPSQIAPTSAVVTCPTVSAGSSDAFSIYWEYGTTTAYGSTTAGSPSTLPLGTSGAVSGSFTGLTPTTLYHYRLTAINGQGVTHSADATFTTFVAPVLTTTAASSIADLSATLNGTINPNGYYYYVAFEFGTDTTYGSITITSRAFGSTTVTISSLASNASVLPNPSPGLLPNTTYHYRIKASANGSFDPSTSFYGNDMTFTTGPPATPPSVTFPIFFPNTSSTTTTVTLNPSIHAGSSAATVVIDYGIDTSYGSQFSYPSTFAVSTITSPPTVITGLTPGTTYHYRFTLTNTEGTTVGGDTIISTLAAPTVTTNDATYLGATSASLNGTYNPEGGTYTVSFDYGLTTAYGSNVAVPVVSGGGGGIIVIIIGGGGGGSFTDHAISSGVLGLTQLTTYHYRLKLVDSAGNTYYGADDSFTTPTPIGAWRLSHFNDPSGSGDGADTANPSGDGIPNLLKYALGMDPGAQGTPPQPVLVDNGDGTQCLSLTFQRYLANTDITIEVQAADSPAGPWTTIASSIAGASVTGTGAITETVSQQGFLGNSFITIADQVTVSDTVSTADAPRRFMRLSVTR